jgi:hypothetical protein
MNREYSWGYIKELVNAKLKDYIFDGNVHDPVDSVYSNILPRAIDDVFVHAYLNNDYSENMAIIRFAYEELKETGGIGSDEYKAKFAEMFSV